MRKNTKIWLAVAAAGGYWWWYSARKSNADYEERKMGASYTGTDEEFDQWIRQQAEGALDR